MLNYFRINCYCCLCILLVIVKTFKNIPKFLIAHHFLSSVSLSAPVSQMTIWCLRVLIEFAIIQKNKKKQFFSFKSYPTNLFFPFLDYTQGQS